MTVDFARRFWDRAYLDGDDLVHWRRELPDPASARLLSELEDADRERPAGGARPAPARRARRVLEVGCGTGDEGRWLAARGDFEVLGLDLSLAALARTAGSCRVGWRPVVGSVLGLPVADGSVDLVLDAGCLHTIGTASRGLYARELTRVCVAGGWLLVRGAASDDEEQGVFAVGERDCRRWLERDWEAVWSMPLDLAAAGGTLRGVAVAWRRRDAGGAAGGPRSSE